MKRIKKFILHQNKKGQTVLHVLANSITSATESKYTLKSIGLILKKICVFFVKELKSIEDKEGNLASPLILNSDNNKGRKIRYNYVITQTLKGSDNVPVTVDLNEFARKNSRMSLQSSSATNMASLMNNTSEMNISPLMEDDHAQQYSLNEAFGT